MAKHIKINGEELEVKPKDGKRFTLEELQGFVGGTIDFAYMPSGRVLVVNDNGKLEGLERNDRATQIWQAEYPIEKYPVNNDGLIVGDVLLMSREEDAEQNKEDES